jgi:hypothetical protein
MIRHFLAVSSATLLAVSFVALPAFAATGTSAMGTVVTNVGTAVTSSGSSNTSSNTAVGSNGSTGIGVSVTGNTSSSSNTTATGVSVSTGNGVSTSGMPGVSVGTNSSSTNMMMTTGTLTLSSSDSAVMNANSMTTPDGAMVSSGTQLNTYAAAVVHSDSNIQNVQLSNTMVGMTYKEQGKLFGFIPLSVNTHAQVDQTGAVTITYPWYHFLVSTDDSGLQSNIQASVHSTMANFMPAAANAQLSARAQAELMDDLEAGFKSHSMTSGSMGSSASSSDTTDGMASTSAQ